MRIDTIDALDAMASISTNKYEASLFMSAARAAEVTRRVVAALRARIKAGKVDRWRLLTDSLYREQELDHRIRSAVRALYIETNRRPGVENPRPSSGLMVELARAYRKRTRSALSLLRLATKGLGLMFEEHPTDDWRRPMTSPRAPRSSRSFPIYRASRLGMRLRRRF